MDDIDYKNNFDSILADACDKYDSKKEKYGDSWKTMSIKELQWRLREEISEWNNECFNKDNTEKEYNELLDIINCALMLAKKKLNEGFK